MTRPDDIPQRVWDEAQSVMMESRLFMIATDDFDEHSSIIARAILAAEQREREACAQVAQAEAERTRARMDPTLLNRMIHADSAWGMCSDTASIIRDAIRNRKETP